MPTYVVKAAKGIDLYILWSTVVDNVVFWGTRDEVRAELMCPFSREDHERWEFELSQVEKRLARADEHGTSALFDTSYFGWDDKEFIVNNLDDDIGDAVALLPRENLLRYINRLEKDESVLDLLRIEEVE